MQPLVTFFHVMETSCFLRSEWQRSEQADLPVNGNQCILGVCSVHAMLYDFCLHLCLRTSPKITLLASWLSMRSVSFSLRHCLYIYTEFFIQSQDEGSALSTHVNTCLLPAPRDDGLSLSIEPGLTKSHCGSRVACFPGVVIDASQVCCSQSTYALFLSVRALSSSAKHCTHVSHCSKVPTGAS